jgi:hypothetical protein
MPSLSDPIFQRFLRIGSATTLARPLISENTSIKYRKLIGKGMLYKMLNTSVYVGVAIHKRFLPEPHPSADVDRARHHRSDPGWAPA